MSVVSNENNESAQRTELHRKTFGVSFECYKLMTATEEKWLRGKFGKEYIEYCKKVNRILPWISKNKKQIKKRWLSNAFCL